MDNIYTIKISYATGDSFGSEDTEQNIDEINSSDLEMCKRNLIRIKEHYEYYKEMNDYSAFREGKSKKEIKEKYKNKDWFVEEYDFSLKLEIRPNAFIQFSAFWCGYFERLYFAEIVTTGNNDMKIIFNDH